METTTKHQPIATKSTDLMNAVVYSQYGSPSVYKIKERNKPSPNAHEVLIKVHRTTASAADTKMRQGKPYIGRLYTGLTKPKRPVPGVEFTGEVIGIGKQVSRFKVGDRVVGETAHLGCYAEYLCIAEREVLTHLPASISYGEASPICAGAVTALNFLRMANIQSGKKLLVYGASGSVGSYAVQLAHYFGAEVTAVCSAKNAELVLSLGAKHVIDYHTQDFAKLGQQYDIVFDAVGKITFSQSKPALKAKGIYLSVDLSLSLFRQLIWTSIFGKQKAKFSATGALPIPKRLAYLKEIIRLMERGKLKSVIDRCYPLEEMVKAHQYVDTGRKKGNVVIIVS